MDDVHARLLQLARPLDVAPLVEAGLQLDEADRLLSVLGAVDQRRDERAVVGGAIDGRLHRDHVGVVGRGGGEGLEARPERLVRLMDEQVAAADLVEEAARVLHAREARLRDRHPRLGLQIGPVETRELHQVGEVEQALDLVDLVVADVEALAKPVEHARRRRGRHLDPDDVAEAAAPELGLDGLEEVVGVVRHLEVGVARDAEEHALGDLHPGEERGQEVRDHRLERHEPRPGVDEPVEPFRHLDAGEPLLGGVRVDREHAEREREPRDVRERLPGADRERRQHRVDVAREDGLEALQLLGRALLDRHDLDALGGERRAQLALPEPWPVGSSAR